MTERAKIRLAAVGDMALNGRYLELLAQPEMARLTAGIRSLLGPADLTIGNLEGPLTERPLTGRSSRFCLKGHPGHAAMLSAAGIQVLSVANNHILDFGWEAVEDTFGALAAAGIKTVGAGRNLTEARKPLRLSVRGSTICILAYCGVPTGLPIYATDQRAGVAPARADYILADVAAAKENCDFLVVCLHWGQEYVAYPTPEQRRLARKIVSSGANLIVGHHPHVLQGTESFGGGLTAYSLGNFTFSEEEWVCTDRYGNDFRVTYKLNQGARCSAVWRVEIGENREILSHELIPSRLGADLVPVLDASATRTAQLEQNDAVLRRRGYFLHWIVRMLLSRARAQAEEGYGVRSLWKRLHRLRPRHMRDAFRLVAREWQHFRGVK